MSNLTIFNTELIPVYTTDTGEQVVIGRELHESLEIGWDYSTWFKRMIKNCDLEEGSDYSTNLWNNTGTRGKPKKDHILTLDTAKEIAMMQQTPIGKAIRRKLIELEKQVKAGIVVPSWEIKDELERAKAWVKEEEKRRMLETKNSELEQDNLRLETQVGEMEPKVDVYEEFIEKGESLGIRETANLLGVYQNDFTTWLELKNFIYRKKDKSRSIRARAQYLDKENNKKKWFDEKLVPCHDEVMRKQVFVTSQGQSDFRRMLKDIDLKEWIQEQKLKIEMEQQVKENTAQ